jgi:hypothetical protein
MNPSDLARYVGAAPTWLAQLPVSNVIDNPANDAVLADTSSLASGYYDIFAFVSNSAAVGAYKLMFDHRNAANTANIARLDLQLPANSYTPIYLYGIKVAQNERFRFFVSVGWTGRVSTMIYAIRRV